MNGPTNEQPEELSLAEAQTNGPTPETELFAPEGSNVDEAPVDDSPQEGDLLAPGDYFIEMMTSSPVRREVLSAGLNQRGFADVWHDQSRARGDAAFAVREHRFVGRLTRPIRIHQQERIRWMVTRRIGIDVLREVKDLRNKHTAFDLVPGTLYEGFFQSSPPPPSLRGIPLRQVVEQTLDEMGFIPHKLIALRRDVPSPYTRGGLTNQTVTLWFGFLEWDCNGPAGFVTTEDPFYFEELTAL
jgi:hypothetical protein